MTGSSRAASRKKNKVLRSDDCEKLQPRLFPFHFEDIFRCARGVLYTRNPSHFDRVRLSPLVHIRQRSSLLSPSSLFHCLRGRARAHASLSLTATFVLISSPSPSPVFHPSLPTPPCSSASCLQRCFLITLFGLIVTIISISACLTPTDIFVLPLSRCLVAIYTIYPIARPLCNRVCAIGSCVASVRSCPQRRRISIVGALQHPFEKGRRTCNRRSYEVSRMRTLSWGVVSYFVLLKEGAPSGS
ncbi:hypothetical protein V8E53_010952, partial [Lactarius tabidus]